MTYFTSKSYTYGYRGREPHEPVDLTNYRSKVFIVSAY